MSKCCHYLLAEQSRSAGYSYKVTVVEYIHIIHIVKYFQLRMARYSTDSYGHLIEIFKEDYYKYKGVKSLLLSLSRVLWNYFVSCNYLFNINQNLLVIIPPLYEIEDQLFTLKF